MKLSDIDNHRVYDVDLLIEADKSDRPNVKAMAELSKAHIETALEGDILDIEWEGVEQEFGQRHNVSWYVDIHMTYGPRSMHHRWYV